jgi:hypothetical protein
VEPGNVDVLEFSFLEMLVKIPQRKKVKSRSVAVQQRRGNGLKRSNRNDPLVGQLKIQKMRD